MADELEFPRQAVAAFAWTSKEHVILYYSDEEYAFSVD